MSYNKFRNAEYIQYKMRKTSIKTCLLFYVVPVQNLTQELTL